MRFTKMHGIGNDFIVVDAMKKAIPDANALARRLCDRRRGIGGDGLILMIPSPRADATMRIINSDGSEPEMCGNGIRCAAKFLYDSGICRKSELDVDTLAGVKHIRLEIEGEQAVAATVDMGAPELRPKLIPVTGESNLFSTELGGRETHFCCVSMGNPHAVTFDLFPDDADFARFGPFMECHPRFPARANIEFCRIDSRSSVTVKVWERGCGATLACGTGSCAVLAAGVQLGLLDRSAEIHLPGGALRDVWADDGHIYMTGPAETVFEGEVGV